MGIVTVPKFLLPPPWLEGSGGNSQMNAADERIAHVFAVPKSGTLDKLEFVTGNVVSVNAASVIRVSFRTVVAATGEPSGVVEQYRDILGSALAANTWISPGLMTSNGTDGGAKRVVTRGDVLVIVIEYQSFTAGDDLNLVHVGNRSSSSISASADGFPYDLFQSSGSWDKVPTGFGPLSFALKYADGTYGRPIAPGQFAANAISNNPFFNSGSAPDERGNRFVVGVPVRTTGAWVAVKTSATSDFEVVLTDTDETTELETVAVDALHSAGTSAAPMFVPFASSHELVAGGTYRLTIRPTTANSVAVQNIVVDADAIMENVFNLNFYGTSRENLGAWSEEETRFYLLGLVIDGLEEGSGAAGGGGVAILSDRGFRRGMIS